MLNLYEEYASQEERESAVMLENAEIAMDRALLSLNTCCAMQELDMRAAEARLVLECGGVENLMDYYEDAAENTADKKEGLLKRAWKAILNFLTSIKEAIFGKAPKVDPEKEVEVEQVWLDKHPKIKKAADAVKRAIKNPTIAAIGIAAGACAAIATVKVVKGKKVKMKAGKVEQLRKEEEKATDELLETVGEAVDKSIGTSLHDAWKDLQGKVSESVKELKGTATGIVGALKSAVSDAASDVQHKAVRALPGFDKAKQAYESGKAVQKDIDLLVKAGYLDENYNKNINESADDFFGESAEVDEIAELLATL